jgi:glucose/arabinose dehydrogenase
VKTQFKFTIRAISHSFSGITCAGAVLIIAASAQAQNLFVSVYNGGTIAEITPGGAQSTFASGLGNPTGLAFNSAGDLFASDYTGGHIYDVRAGRIEKHLCFRVG